NFGLRAHDVLGGALVGQLLGLAPGAVSTTGIDVLVNAPVVLFALASSSGDVTFPFPLPNAPGFAGLQLFGQMASIDAGAPQGIAASDGLQFGLCSLHVTDVAVTNTVRLAGAKRLGLNIGAHDRWGAGKILKNQLPNPGFEPGLFGTVWLASTGSTSDRFVPR